MRILRSPRFWTLALVVIAIAVVHHSGIGHHGSFHQLLDIVPYLPIILGALWFGLAGGIACAALTTICYTSHLYLYEGGDFLGSNLHQTLNIALFNVVGLVTGYLSQRQLTAMERYQKVAAELERSYADLREKTEALLQSEELLRRASKLSTLGELTAGLAHEVGNPLGGIKGAAEILADGLPEGDPRQRFARLLLQEVSRLDRVVSQFLSCARPSQEESFAASIGDVFHTVTALCAQAASRAQLTLETTIEPDLPPAAASPHQLQQVFLNLVLNSIQASRPGGHIELEARRRGDAIACSVIDDGRGIPPEHRRRLFEPFFTTRPGGTGLGLAITSRIVESFGGRIEVESDPGRRTVFTVTIPLRTPLHVEETSAGYR